MCVCEREREREREIERERNERTMLREMERHDVRIPFISLIDGHDSDRAKLSSSRKVTQQY